MYKIAAEVEELFFLTSAALNELVF